MQVPSFNLWLRKIWTSNSWFSWINWSTYWRLQFSLILGCRYYYYSEVGCMFVLETEKRQQNWYLTLRRSIGDGSKAGGFWSSQDGYSIIEDEKKGKKEGLLLGAERDVTGSVVGFHLIPSSGTKYLNDFTIFLLCLVILVIGINVQCDFWTYEAISGRAMLGFL